MEGLLNKWQWCWTIHRQTGDKGRYCILYITV